MECEVKTWIEEMEENRGIERGGRNDRKRKIGKGDEKEWVNMLGMGETR